ncbi:hypothetical protein [Antribacter gilvus]|uniref:hypothetical protein n=1 Tax=Antribacter gilvus TaxID=2304675 RepID=UPI000F79029B|nr:hypothetical protein [Antribacter gilvus]
MTDAPLADPSAVTSADAVAEHPAEPVVQAGHRPALVGILATVLAVWAIVPMALVHYREVVSFGFTEANAIFLMANSAMVAVLVLAASAATRGSRRLLTSAWMVTGFQALVQVGILVVQVVLGATLVLTLGTVADLICLGLVFAGLGVGRSAMGQGPTSQRTTAVVLIVGAAVLLQLTQMVMVGPSPLLLLRVVATVGIVAAAGLLGVPSASARYGAAGLLTLFVVSKVAELPWGARDAARAYLAYEIASGSAIVLGIAAAVLAVVTARQVSRPTG